MLQTPAKPVKKFDAKLEKLIKDMEDTLVVQKDPEGVGLAAPQIGIGLAVFIIKPSKKSPVTAYINPKLLKVEEGPKKAKKDKTSLEGCLSVDRIWSPITRPQRIQLEYQNVKGEKHEQWYEGFDAVIIQHEVDHLNGILFTQRALEQGQTIYQEEDGELYKVTV